MTTEPTTMDDMVRLDGLDNMNIDNNCLPSSMISSQQPKSFKENHSQQPPSSLSTRKTNTSNVLGQFLYSISLSQSY